MICLPYNQKLNQPLVLALGFFDCMHLGHKQLVDTAKQLAKDSQSKTAVFTFSNNHFSVLNKSQKLLFTFEERKTLFQNVGVDFAVYATFDKEFMSTDAQTFLTTLKNTFQLKGVVVGFDYTCGKDRKDCFFVKNFFEKYDIPTKIVQQVNFENEKISSTRIRKLLSTNLDKANQLMAHQYFLVGTVEKGRGCGKTMGFPTANVKVEDDKLLPLGVFTADVEVDDKTYKSIVNIGPQPTFGLEEKVVIEAFLQDFQGDLYQKQVVITPKKFIREVKKFNSKEQLVAQLKEDLEKLYD